jgi:hypothetical protein
MPTPTRTEEQLAQIGRRIDRLDLSARATVGEAAIGMQRRVTALRKQEASARAAVYEAAASIEQRVRRLDTTVGLAEQWAVADVAEDVGTFVDAVTAELHDWDVHIERLQLRAATTAGSGRQQAEAAISELRRRRNVLGERIGDVRSASGEEWRGSRKRVRAARDELERGVAETEAGLDGERTA